MAHGRGALSFLYYFAGSLFMLVAGIFTGVCLSDGLSFNLLSGLYHGFGLYNYNSLRLFIIYIINNRAQHRNIYTRDYYISNVNWQ